MEMNTTNLNRMPSSFTAEEWQIAGEEAAQLARQAHDRMLAADDDWAWAEATLSFWTSAYDCWERSDKARKSC